MRNYLSGNKIFLFLLVGFLTLEFLSWIGYNHPIVSSGLFIFVVALVAIGTWFRPSVGVLAVLGELFIGSQGGYMLALGPANIDGAILSLRMGIFLVVFGVWLTRTTIILCDRKGAPAKRLIWLKEMRRGGLLWPYLILLLTFTFGALRGILASHDFAAVFFDANGYAFYALFPAFVEGFYDLIDRRICWFILAAALTVSVTKALAVLYFFSHRIFYIAANMYLWIRDTRVGEIAIMSADFHRVFFQSHLFILVGLFSAFLFAARARLFRGKAFWWPFLIFVWGLIGMILGLSRSFWFGGFFGFFLFIILLVKLEYWARLWKKMLVIAPLGLVLAIGIVSMVYLFPYPIKTGDLSLSFLMKQRALSLVGEAAANSRWELLAAIWPIGFEHPIFGSGLGQEVTYTTFDPRLLADIPDAQYTTYAFEWGYHDLWIKFGLLGLVVYAWFVAVILKPYFTFLKNKKGYFNAVNEQEIFIVVGLLSGTAAMLITNVFSPYLNHPLGIGLLMAAAAMGLSEKMIESNKNSTLRVED
jgi:hypothetical protein